MRQSAVTRLLSRHHRNSYSRFPGVHPFAGCYLLPALVIVLVAVLLAWASGRS